MATLIGRPSCRQGLCSVLPAPWATAQRAGGSSAGRCQPGKHAVSMDVGQVQRCSTRAAAQCCRHSPIRAATLPRQTAILPRHQEVPAQADQSAASHCLCCKFKMASSCAAICFTWPFILCLDVCNVLLAHMDLQEASGPFSCITLIPWSCCDTAGLAAGVAKAGGRFEHCCLAQLPSQGPQLQVTGKHMCTGSWQGGGQHMQPAVHLQMLSWRRQYAVASL